MKKLMTMIAAVAASFGLFADVGNTWDPGTVTENYTLDVSKTDNNGTSGTTYWSYAPATAVSGDEATVTTDKTLVLKTGANTLTRNITGLEWGAQTPYQPTTIPADSNEVGLFFDTKAIFGAPCDEFASDLGDAKFAAFFLDETELENMPNDFVKGTNLWVIGSDGSGVDTAFRMQLFKSNGSTPVTVDEAWLMNAENRVVVKAYADGNGTLPGFVVYVADASGNGNFAKVIGKAPITDGNLGTYTKVTTGDYLTGAIGVPGRYADCQLVLGREAATGLYGEAFKGTGTITALAVGDTCPIGLEDLFAETQYMTVSATDVTINVTEGATYDSAAGTFAGKNGTTVKFTVTSTEPATKTLITVDIGGVKCAAEGDVYTITFDADETLTVAAVVPVATVNDTAYATFAEVLEAVEDLTSVNLVLNNAAIVEDEAYITIDSSAEWTIDLNGKTLTFCLSGMNACINNAGILTIKDSATGGKIENPAAEDASALISNESTGVVDIQAGIFDGAVSNSEGTIKVHAGTKFLKGEDGSINTKETIAGYAEAAGENLEVVEESGYWMVQVKQKTNLNGALIKLVKDSIIYGEAAPTVESVEVNETTLVENKDYTVVCEYTAGDDVATYEITVKAAEDGDYTGEKAVSFTVTAKALTITGMTAANKVYDKTTNATISGGALEGIINGDDVTTTFVTAGAFDQADVGTDISVTFTDMELTGTKAGNYTLTQPELTADITVATPNITAPLVATEVDAGTALKDITFTTAGSATGVGGETVNGAFAWANGETQVNETGAFDVTFTPESSNYAAGTRQVTVTVKSAAPDPVVPGGDIPTGDPQALADEINKATDKTPWIKAPADAGELTADQAKAYAKWFKAVPGEGKVTIELDPDQVDDLRAKVNAEVVQKIKPAELAAMTGSTDTVQIDAIPGFYYAVRQGNGIGTMKVENAGIAATGTGKVDLTMKKYDGAGFYTIVISDMPIAAEN